jgi:nucleoside-diphosphate-sugar epimerase
MNKPQTATNSEHWLVIGGTRGVAHALVSELAHQNISCTVFVRDAAKARRYFGDKETVSIVEGEVATDAEGLIEVAHDTSHIFMGQSFPYSIWEKSLRSSIDNCLAAAQDSGAQFIYPGRIYPKGLQTPITEATPNEPLGDCKQGAVLKEIEAAIEQATLDGKCRARIVRHAYPYGPAVGDGMLEKNFREIPQNTKRSWWQTRQKFEWIGTTEVPVQLAYTPDLARFIVEYAHHESNEAFSVINFAGHTFESMDEFGKGFCELADEEYQADPYSHAMLTIAATMGRPEAKRGNDIFYSFENSILLDDAKMHALFPQFKMTEPTVAQYQTLKWYQEQYA